MTKKDLKRKRTADINKENVPEEEVLPAKRMSDDPIPKKVQWINRQRVLVFCTRGISYRHRHLMDDLKTLMPHHRVESKMERTKNLQVVNEMCEMKNCNKTILFEGRRKKDLYMWFSNIPTGPCAKFLVENIYTMGELKMTGNCLRGSRPLLSFDENFNTKPHYSLLKELLVQIFGVPYHHPKKDGGLAEIGPRFVLNPIKIFAESFGGEVLWDNPAYISPAKLRGSLKNTAAGKYINKVEQKIAQEVNKPKESYSLNPLDEIFKGDPLEKALELKEKEVEVPQTIDSKKKKLKKNKNITWLQKKIKANSKKKAKN
ncbi:Ribosome biogenesis protein BRX1 like protein [Habropoda laboriosa]|uniref:Ribosome biogenesis protein BRX1 homolog n=1 Tax=Habropoda laboriosa TaxID=597456 RepID=A0A0L7QWR3_9HYME|nr:Ribosome biogenesis protein BRX1 like protein [Habropoda laboriosa]